MPISPLLVQITDTVAEWRTKYLVLHWLKTKAHILCAKDHTTLCQCVWDRKRDLVYLLRRYSMPCKASMSLFPFFLCLVLSATRWRSGTLLLRGIKHCIFRLWLTDPLYGLHNHLFLRTMGRCGEWCHAASPTLLRCSQNRSQPKVERKFFFILFFFTVHLCSVGYNLNSHQHSQFTIFVTIF